MRFIEELFIPTIVLMFIGAYAFDIRDIRDAGENLKLAAPLLVLLALACLAVIASVVRKFRIKMPRDQSAEADMQSASLVSRKIISIPILSAMYLAAISFLGMIASTTVLVLALLLIMDGRVRLAGVSYAILLSVAVLVLFEFLLGKDLPGYF